MYDADSEEQDAAEQLARDGVRPLVASDARGTRSLLSSARHELGSPLQSIQGFSELLASEAFGSLTQEQRGFVEHILTASGELRSAMEACLELAELELVGRPAIGQRGDLQGAVLEALEQAQQRTSISLSVQPSTLRAPVLLDRELFARAFETLLIALSARDVRSFSVAIEREAQSARVTIARTARHARVDTESLLALAARRHITRNLLWFRLASALFAAQDAALSVSEALDYAEVRIRLSPTH